MFISWMLIMLSFKKSLIVEQFQGNYLKDKGSIKITSDSFIDWILTKFAYFTRIPGPYAKPKENSSKKITEANFSNLVSYCYIPI